MTPRAELITSHALEQKITALEGDLAEIQRVVRENNSQKSPNAFTKLNIEKKILRVHSELLETAKQAGITLPG